MSREKSNCIKLLKEAKVGKPVLDAIASVDRKKFFDPIFADRAWSPGPIPIGAGQTSDDLAVLARMIGLLAPKKKWRILEVGTGSGYSTAVLSLMAREVVTIEYHEELARSAKERVIGAGYSNTRFFTGDATDFDGPLGEFDGVIVFAACVRTPYFLVNVVKEGGFAVFPMGPAHQQQITHFVNNPAARRTNENYRFYELCTFPSIRGVYGWVDEVEAEFPEPKPEIPAEEKPE